MSDEIQIIIAGGEESSLSELLCILTQQLMARGNETSGGALGGAFGYGAHFENDVFLMRPYCWCERDDCPWCGGCSGEHFEDIVHGPACYQTRLKALKEKYGKKEPWGWYVRYDCKPYEDAKRALCRELRRDFGSGNEVHCTCGAQREAEKRYEACECDWHQGRGPFRFGKAVQAPNFWHKPSGFAVRWYKYIGRGMEIDNRPDRKRLGAIFAECFASIGQPSIAAAADEYELACADERDKTRRAFEYWASPEGQVVMDEMMESGIIRTFEFGGDGNPTEQQK